MEQRLLLNLGQGDWQTGFASVTAQLWENQQPPIQFVGSLPPWPQMATQYQRWQQLYEAIYGSQSRWRRAASPFEFETAAVTNVSHQEFATLCTALHSDLNQWLMAATFAPIERRLRTHLSAQAALQVMLTAHAKSVLRFPWGLWQLFDDYPQAELSLSLPDYHRALKQTQGNPTGAVRVLAVLGNDTDIDVETDRQILSQLPQAQVTLLAQPSLGELQHQLWEFSWDILFFAGHSTSQGQGYLQVNQTESLSIEQLKYALGRTIHNGLQLAILNSCDGLGLAWALADLHLPQTIVMREPVPDAIAHQFLKGFLAAFASGQPLYSAVREAREKLHGLSELGVCAAWLPVIVQNPAEVPPTWPQLAGQPEQILTPMMRPQPQLAPRWVGLGSLAVTIAILALRWAGILQPAELWAYGALMQLRPAETPDPRLVVVTVDETDIQSQTAADRRGSVADETLHQALTLLAEGEPRLIGLDLYRDFSARDLALIEALGQPNLVGLCKSRDAIAGSVGISPPPELPLAQVGFSDFIEEADGLVRRQLLTLTPDPVSPCQSSYGFAALVAIHYLTQTGLSPRFTAQGNLQIGDVVFPRLNQRTGGLQRIDNGGNQLLLNYRALPDPEQIAATISLQQLLSGQVNLERLRDRIVLIGVTAPSGGDYWSTPYGAQAQSRTAGVFMQAQMISQLISAVEDGRALIWVWPQWAEALCIALGAIAGSLLARRWQSARLALACVLLTSGLTIAAWATLLMGGWLPLLPTLAALNSSALLTATLTQTSERHSPLKPADGGP
ncbi:CHASE2 domain-containing protein [Nodosilinea sp. LEGE 07298]|uniref:CHASE2 domain-containing protein n=1 Tax=Nodosilinea sp. LEGE 07298 TaxID=2777970 RepID=UPI00187E0DCA|nr:CHASE2 domain-containing protein [Nodosilinea sp. LEGE 07298]MBE9113178.1 CHASE2 domain-containing protein [Nodosilinea sp. LEGE 07298]